MKREHSISIFLALMLFSTIAGAQEKLLLNLDEARKQALQYNRNLINSGLALDQSQQQLKQAIAAGLPQINATADYTNSLDSKIKIQFDENMPASEIPIKPTSNFNIRVTQLLFSANYIVAVQSAKLYKTLSATNLEKTEEDIISQVTDAYYLVVISAASIEILKNNTANLEDLYNKTGPLLKVGMIEKVELDQLRIQLNSLKNSLKTAERQYELTKNMLRLLLGVPAETELELTETTDSLMAKTDSPALLAQSFNTGNNLDYQLLNTREQIAHKQVNMQKANYLPTLSGFYSYNYKILKPRFDMSPPHVLGLNLSIPIFSGGERLAKVHQAKIDREIIINNREYLKDQLNIQHKQLTYNLANALEQYETQKENIEVARDVYKNLQDKFNQGIISGMDIIIADNNFLKAESEFLQAKLSLLKAQNELNKLLGNLKK